MESSLYSADYFVQRRSNGYERQIAYQQEWRRVCERVRPGFILDVGCGTGEFLDVFWGDWEKYGIEISEYCIDLCRSKGITMVDFDSLRDDTFDLVIFRGVLQHLDNPFQALREARRVLAPGGLIAILAQPDADSLCYRLFGDLPALDAPRNWWIPGRREITNILKRLGFQDIEVNHPYWGGPYARPLKDFANFFQSLMGVRRKFAFPGNMMEVYARKG